ncbi:hypothetical protein R3P38DRAFT_2781600 [Favolaschia claudopus]|uniref:Uncharacterized protein n=1 Tax=Favolaschia claudopus TaxID=2862362 RepID=A0AAW0B7U2_9AGAR
MPQSTGVSSKLAILVLLNPASSFHCAVLLLFPAAQRTSSNAHLIPAIAPFAIPAGFGSVMSAAAPIASMAPSAVPALVADAYAPAQTGFAPPSGQSCAATGRVEIPQALNPVYGYGQKTFSSPPQLLAGTKRPLKALPGADYRVGDTPIQAARAVIDLLRMDRSFLVSSLQPAGLPRNLISLQFVSEDAGTGAHELSSHEPTRRVRAAAGGEVELVRKMKARARNSVVPSPLREVVNTSAVNAAPEAPSIADSIAANLLSACANSFEDITSILADTDDEDESSDTIIDLDTVTAPVSLPS